MQLIETKSIGSGGSANITFTSIPATYTDLKIMVSGRVSQSTTQTNPSISFNGSTSNFVYNFFTGSGTTTGGSGGSANVINDVNAANSTANVFTNFEIFIPNYASAKHKSFTIDSAQENDASNAYVEMWTMRWAVTDAINAISLISGSTWVEGTVASLYGISKVTSSPKATGGIVSQDASYWYHMFPFTSTFTPTESLTNVDYLVIAGGGGGSASGAGAGGLRTTVGATTGGGGTIESKISLSSGTAYTITIGAGGAGSSNGQTTAGSNGANSSISGTGLTTITAIGGGAGTPGGANAVNGISGGSGSGGFVGGGGVGQTGLGGAGTTNQGYAGGNSSVGESSQSSTGSGGGAGGPGQVGTKLVGAVGGSGMSIPSIANATFTGVNGYYAGGGGSAIYDTGNTPGLGGVGGGGNAASNTIAGSSGVANTGGGAGGYYSSNYYTAAYRGGSGLVVLRYAK